MVDNDKTKVIETDKPATKVKQGKPAKTVEKRGRRPGKNRGYRMVLFLFLIWLLCFNGFSDFLNVIDQSVYQSFSSLISGKKIDEPNRFVKITLSPTEMELLNNSPENLKEFRLLLNELIKNPPLVSVLFTERFPNLIRNRYLEQIRKDLKSIEPKSGPEVKEIKKLLRTAQRGDTELTRSLMLKSQLITCLTNTAQSGQQNSSYYSFGKKMTVSGSESGKLYRFLPESAKFNTLPFWNGGSLSDLENRLPVVRVTADHTYGWWPAVWLTNEGFIPDVATILHAGRLNVEPVWEDRNKLVFGFSETYTGPEGYIRPVFHAAKGTPVETFTLEAFNRLKQKPDLSKKSLIICQTGDTLVDRVILASVCIGSGNTIFMPVAAIWGCKLLLVVSFVFLAFVASRLRSSVSVLITLILCGSLVVCMIGFLILKYQWVPLMPAVLFLLFGQIYLLIVMRRNRFMKVLQKKSDTAHFRLGEFQYEQSRYEQAFASLKECSDDKKVLELLYKTGVALERKRQYDVASKVFHYISSVRPGYKDAGERGEMLSNLVFGRTSSETAGMVSGLDLSVNGLSRPVLGRYEIEKELGRGAMGIVYLGTDPRIGRPVAIKTMDFTRTFEGRFEEVKDRFFREAKAAGRLAHPNIVTIYDAGEEQDLAYIAMDFVVGNTLNNYVSGNTLLPVEIVFSIISQAADALDYAHKQNIIHRDIKPANIIYNPDSEQIMLTDFGIARIADNTTTRPGIVLGSPSFMSPEQLRGKEIDGRADIFSLGVTMYQLLTGRLPFKGTDLTSLGYQIVSVKHTPVRNVRADLPQSAERIIGKALQKAPEKRYQNAGNMARILRNELKNLR